MHVGDPVLDQIGHTRATSGQEVPGGDRSDPKDVDSPWKIDGERGTTKGGRRVPESEFGLRMKFKP